MTTPHLPVDEIDDIIELTDIIEEGTLPTPHAASPEKAVDAKSLDNELDALLNDIVPTETSSLDPDDDFDLDALFATDPAQAQQSAPADQDISQAETMPVPGSEVDLSELDELFDALKTSSNDLTEENALDALLLGDGPEPEPMSQSPATAPDAAPDIPTDISADISAESALDADTKEPAAAALSADDLDLDLRLTGLDEPVNLPSAPAPANELHAAENAENLPLPEPDKSGPALQDANADFTPVKDMLIEEISNDLDLPGLVDPPHQTAPPTAQEAAHSAKPQTNVEQAVTDTATVNAGQQAMARMSLEMDHLSSRVDALEVWKDQPAQPVANPEDVDALREQLATALARLEALEARPVLNTEELSASLMSTFTTQQDAALDILRQDSANLAERLDQAHAQPVASPEDVDALREQLATALARLEALEARPVLNTEELSASLMSTWTAQQDAALDIVRQDSVNLAERLDQAHAQPVASPEDVDALREQLATALARLEALEARPVLNAEELSASLMSTFTAQQDAALDILRQDSANLAERLEQAHAQPVASPEDVDALREQLATALARLEALEALEARPVLNAEELSASLMSTFTAQQDAALDTVRQKLTHLAENEQTLARHIEQIRSLPVFNPQDLTSLQAEISACGEQLTTAMSTVSSLATLKNTAQELDSDVATLRKVLQRQEAELLSLREALSAKDTRIDALQSTMQEMYTALKNFQSQQPSMAGLRDELQTYIRQQVPAAAAHIIREEIAELLQEMGEE